MSKSFASLFGLLVLSLHCSGEGSSVQETANVGCAGSSGSAGSSGTSGSEQSGSSGSEVGGSGGSMAGSGGLGGSGQAGSGNGGSGGVQVGELKVELSSTPVSGTFVKKQQNVAAVGLSLTASSVADAVIDEITFTGQANLVGSNCNGDSFGGTSCNLAGLSQRVTSIALFDGSNQVGLAGAPDPVTGRAKIEGINRNIPKGSTRYFRVLVSLASTASLVEPFDKITIGIASSVDVVARNPVLNIQVPTSVSSQLVDQVESDAPWVVQTILNNGTLTIQADAHPNSSIVVAGKESWTPLAQYKATAQYEEAVIDRAMVETLLYPGTLADNADFSQVAIASGGAVKNWDVLPSGSTGTKDIDLSLNEIVVPKDSSVQFQIWAKISPIQSSSSVSGAWSGACRSGHVPLIGLARGKTMGEWDESYVDSMNVRATGSVSGERLYAAQGAGSGNPMILRKSQPIITKQSLPSTTLANIDMDVIKFQIATYSAGSISWKQMIFLYSSNGGFQVSNFRVRRGATDLDVNDYNVTNFDGVDLKSNTLSSELGYLVVTFADGKEEVVTGSGYVYTVHPTFSGVNLGDSFTIRPYQNSSFPFVTGYLVNNVGVSISSTDVVASSRIYHLDTSMSPSGILGAIGSFLWSDNSEVPHSELSRDWAMDTFVQDLSWSQTLSL